MLRDGEREPKIRLKIYATGFTVESEVQKTKHFSADFCRG